MFDFTNQVALVTGPAGNLGNATARAFLEAGANLMLVDRSPDRLPQLFPDIADSPDHFLVASVDSTDPDAVSAMAAQAVERFGRIDILVNTVGGFRAGTPLHETPLETLDFLFNLNARTMFIASQVVIPYMLAQGTGKIVNVAARPGLAGRKNMATYSASKSAVIRMTESMAAELKGAGINVNCILPGTIDTPENRQDMPDADHSLWVKPESLANVILFLTSNAARDIHGASLPVYGNS
ncbi:MAG: SDR family NAD(P)-dependent oxidoreductase [Chloroflexota bacterium]|nr:SDR family NAD(P)-dependent oxidoreductase [Chloroflexota bacterium]